MTILAIKILFWVATDFGITSPKTRIRKVMIPVAIPTALFGKIIELPVGDLVDPFAANSKHTIEKKCTKSIVTF